jgi:hypothetical protein
MRLWCVAAVLIIGESLAAAQTTVADGIDAWVRGDYQRAAEILQPLAEPPGENAAAAFFLATLHESGRGVPYDAVRACALYLRAQEHSVPPFDRMAGESLQSLRASLDIKQFEECNLLSAIGFDHGFQPLTFTLGPGHSVTVDAGGATIAYEGHESHIDLFNRIPGIVFLPARHTALTTGRPPTAQRHFIEFFMWEPVPTQGAWSLNWLLFEVIRDDLLLIASDALTTSASARPPLDLDTSEMARVQVTDTGDAEWAVRTGSNPRSELIETEAERQETSRQNSARQAADSEVDWTRAPDPYRPPGLNYSDADGCGDLFVYGWSADRTEAITMRADKDVLQLSTAARTFDLAAQGTDFELLVHVFERAVRSWPFCNDVRSANDRPPETWRATGGTVTIELSPLGVLARSPHLYRATIRVVGAEFVNATGGRVRQVRPITLTAFVGGYIG